MSGVVVKQTLNLAAWNDAPERTIDDVVAALKGAVEHGA